MLAHRTPRRRTATLATAVVAVTLTAGLLTDDKVGKAVDDLDRAIEDYNASVLNGDTAPDSSRIDKAADELNDVCTSWRSPVPQPRHPYQVTGSS